MSQIAPTLPSPVKVDIVSDIVCPWCWLGTRYFNAAVQHSQTDIDVTWRPYMLDPLVPAKGVAYGEYMKKKFGDGPRDRFKAMREHLESAAPDVGIDFKFSEIPMRPNTLNAHRIMKWAQGQGKGNLCAEALFKAFFQDLEDIGDIDVLIKISKKIGLDSEIIADLLTQDNDRDSVMAEIQYFRGLGISGVPSFIYNGQFLVQGAQSVDTHIDAIEKATTLSTSP